MTDKLQTPRYTDSERLDRVSANLGLDPSDVLLGELVATEPDHPEIPRDHLGKPWPRYEYAAAELSGGSPPDKRVVPNFSQLQTVLSTLLEAQEKSQSVYGLDHVILPQDPSNVPYELFTSDRDLANFFAVSCLWMRRTNSVKAMRSVGQMYRTTRDWDRDPFDPNQAADMNNGEIDAMLRPFPQLQMRDFTVPAFRENGRYIRDRLDGDVRAIYRDNTDYQKIVDIVKNQKDERSTSPELTDSKGLRGFGHKMVSMLLYYLADADSIDRPGEKLMPYFDFPLPVDMHVARMSAGTGCVRLEGYEEGANIMSDELQRVLRDMYYDYSLAHGANQLSVANAVWLLGSWFCSYSPETFSVLKELDGRNSLIKPYQPNYDTSQRDASAWLATCGSCPIAPQCTHVSAGKESHLLGKIRLRPRRTDIAGLTYDSLLPPGELAPVALDGLGRHAKNRGMEYPQTPKSKADTPSLGPPDTLF